MLIQITLLKILGHYPLKHANFMIVGHDLSHDQLYVSSDQICRQGRKARYFGSFSHIWENTLYWSSSTSLFIYLFVTNVVIFYFLNALGLKLKAESRRLTASKGWCRKVVIGGCFFPTYLKQVCFSQHTGCPKINAREMSGSRGIPDLIIKSYGLQ